MGDTITSVVRVYERFNKYANEGIRDYSVYRKKIEVKENAATLGQDDDLLHLVDDEYKLVTRALPKNFEISSDYEEHVKIELSLIKYFPIIYLPPKSSLTISQGINYLYYNYIVNENYIGVGHDIYKLSDPSAKQYSYLYENYENTKSNEVKIIFNYTPQSPNLEDGEIDFPLINFGEGLQGSVKLSAKHPKKILDKYYLVEKLKGKDSLIIKFENGL